MEPQFKPLPGDPRPGEVIPGPVCMEIQIPESMLARMEAQFEAIKLRQAELARIRTIVDLAGYRGFPAATHLLKSEQS